MWQQYITCTVEGMKRWHFRSVPFHLNRVRPVPFPRRKGTCARAVYRRKYAVFTPNFARITARYRPKPSISGVIENEVKKGALRFSARSNLRLLSFNNPEYRPLQACFNVETPSSFNFWTACTRAFGCDWTLNGQYFTYIHIVPTNAHAHAHANREFVWSFSPDHRSIAVSHVQAIQVTCWACLTDVSRIRTSSFALRPRIDALHCHCLLNFAGTLCCCCSSNLSVFCDRRSTARDFHYRWSRDLGSLIYSNRLYN